MQREAVQEALLEAAFSKRWRPISPVTYWDWNLPHRRCTAALQPWLHMCIWKGWEWYLLLAANGNKRLLAVLDKFSKYWLKRFRIQLIRCELPTWGISEAAVTQEEKFWCIFVILLYLDVSLQQQRPIKFLNITTAREANFPQVFISFGI